MRWWVSARTAVISSHGEAAYMPANTSTYVTDTRPKSSESTGFSEPESSESKNLEPAEKPMKPMASSVTMRASCAHSGTLRSPTTYGPQRMPPRM